MPKDFKPHFTATGIGSLPHLEVGQAVSDVLERLPEMPYWPQLPARSPLEDMNLQYAPACYPVLTADPGRREVLAHPDLSREEALAAFYERLLGEDLTTFGLGEAEAAGFHAFLQTVGRAPAGAYPWVKGHVTGPLTLAAAVTGRDGKALVFDDELAEAVARGLGAAAAAQAAQMAPLGRPLMIFFDEPYLSGYGSAFTPVNRETVLGLLAASFEELTSRAPEVVIGVHCCGNTDWGLLIEAGADVLNLDSAGYGRHLLLYPEALAQLFARGGAVAWGAVPTDNFRGDETAAGLWQGLEALLNELAAKGFDRQTLADQALVTPACGMGSLNAEKARRILDLTGAVSRLARENWR
ncbi:MAG: hypothetical protein KQJ78_02625 [Deltaproteobacteria bacterium]|nr:hypothetical protein [Deltaproteobacteria bacterium]